MTGPGPQHPPKPNSPFAPTLPGLLGYCAKHFRDNAFLVERSCSLTYGNAERVSAEIACGLLAAGSRGGEGHAHPA